MTWRSPRAPPMTGRSQGVNKPMTTLTSRTATMVPRPCVSMPARPTGWRQSPTTIKVKEGSFEGYRVDSFGQAPWAVVQPRVDLLVKNPGLSRATVLDPNGNAVGEAPVTREATGLRISFPPNALYVVLR